jgi:type I restriction enzyme S subunit
MACEWQSARFAEVCEHSAFGPRFAGELYAADGNVATLRTTDISADGRIEYETMPLARLDLSRLQQHTLRTNDLVITRSGRIGTAALFNGFRLPVLPGAFLIRFRLKTDVAEPLYYRYFFNSLAGQALLTSVATGSVQQNLNITSVHGLEIPVPPLAEQRAIAHILGTLDDKIELNRRTNETLEAMAWALFSSWFVDFDPVRAKAEARDSDLPKPFADLFPAHLVGSELGEIPEGWQVGCVDDEFGLTMGQSPPGETYNELGEGIPFYQGRADFGPRFPTRRVYCTAPTRLAGAGDTLISVRAPVGDINMASESCAIGRGVAAARHRSGSRSYSYQFMLGLEEVFARFEAEGTVFGSIGKKDFHAISCVKPPRAVIAEFERMLSPLDNRIDVTECESRRLAALRDLLLPKLISGELRVKDAQRFCERADA